MQWKSWLLRLKRRLTSNAVRRYTNADRIWIIQKAMSKSLFQAFARRSVDNPRGGNKGATTNGLACRIYHRTRRNPSQRHCYLVKEEALNGCEPKRKCFSRIRECSRSSGLSLATYCLFKGSMMANGNTENIVWIEYWIGGYFIRYSTSCMAEGGPGKVEFGILCCIR